MGRAYVRKCMKELTYPGNQDFHHTTLEPRNEETEKRIELAKINMPELIDGGESLLDIGSNKGFVSFYYRSRYKKITGYEPMSSYHDFSNHLKEYLNIGHIHFLHGGFRDILFDKSERDKYTVVYVGGVHHHFYRDALAVNSDYPFLYLKKLAGLADKFLILDGPFNCDYHTVRRFAEDGKWTDKQKADFNLDNHIEHLKPQFEFVRVNANEKGRHTAVFKRVKPDIEAIELKDIKDLIAEKGEPIKANKLREGDNVFKIGDRRYKFDPRHQSDGVYLAMNGMPKYFPKTINTIQDNGKRAGDVTEWIEGEELKHFKDLFPHWLKMNNELSTLGLMEIHFKRPDFKKRNGNILDVDVDMIRGTYMITREYFKKWLAARKEEVSDIDLKHFDFLVKNINRPDVFFNILKEL